ncbi:MAG: TonB-dependent receptor [Tannerellaceae bacterium]|jgi:hypothetical protein|nr:TonB-dependent receptor [Tannerellaceae bacterium]
MARRIFKTLTVFLFVLFAVSSVYAQGKRYTVSGTIRDKDSGEDLIGAEVIIAGTRTGVVTNNYGYYSITLSEGRYRLVFSYIGFLAREEEVDLRGDIKLNIDLSVNARELGEVIVSAERRNANVVDAGMSAEKLSAKAIKTIPALMGEVDVIKAVQLLPGVQSTSEGSSGFSVRGGGHDQNLILLDEATVYNASHLMGFFSVFNNDAVKDVTLYKGDIPASFGGRLSSLLDIRSKDGNNQRYSATGGIGIISSRITAEGPLGDKASAIVSARRTYADIFLAFAKDKSQRDATLYFYDMNAKVNMRLDDNNRVFLSGYLGRDRFGADIAGMGFGNKTLTARWNHIFSPKVFSNFTVIGSAYDYYLRSEISPQLSQELRSGLEDYGFKADFSFHPNPSNSIKAGYNFMYHVFLPGEGGGIGEESVTGRLSLPREYAAENVVYLSNESSVAGERLKLKYGLRYSMFHNIEKARIVNTISRLEPRLGATYVLDDNYSVKASYSRTVQYIQLASNSSAGSPLDLWFQASDNVKPQLCDQFALGYFRNFADNAYEVSVEAYYKDMKDVVDFKDHAQLMINEDMDKELRFGKGNAYGLEFMLRKTDGPLSGWISYTLSRSRRKIEGVNEGREYRSPYDKPHNISVVTNYEVTPRVSLSTNWVYATGTPVTYPTGRFKVEDSYVPIYSSRNEYRYPDYHRLDLSVTWQLTPPDRRFRHELNFSLYNAYGRKNVWTILFRQEADRPDISYAEKIYLFTYIPSVTWNFTF